MAEAINSFSTWHEYFEEIVEQLPELNTFKLGDPLRYINGEMGDIQYPCLWLEWPEMEFKDAGAENYRDEKTFGFAVIKACDVNDYTTQNAAMLETQDIMRKIFARMIKDRRDNRLLNWYLPVKFEPIIEMGISTSYGWRAELSTSGTLNLFYDSNDWTV